MIYFGPCSKNLADGWSTPFLVGRLWIALSPKCRFFFPLLPPISILGFRGSLCETRNGGLPTLWAHIFARHKNHMFIDISKHVTENTTHTKQSAKNQKWPKLSLAQLELGLRGKTRGVIRTLAQVESARVVLSSCSSIGRDDVIHGRRTPFALKRLAKQTRHERSCVNYALSKQHKTAVTITAPNKRSSPNSWVVLFSLLSPVGCCFSFAFGAVRFCHLSPSRAVLPSPPCWLCIIPLLGSGAALVAVPLFLWVGPLSTLSSFSLDERKEVLLSLLGGVAFLLLWGGVVCLRLLGFGWCSQEEERDFNESQEIIENMNVKRSRRGLGKAKQKLMSGAPEESREKLISPLPLPP